MAVGGRAPSGTISQNVFGFTVAAGILTWPMVIYEIFARGSHPNWRDLIEASCERRLGRGRSDEFGRVVAVRNKGLSGLREPSRDEAVDVRASNWIFSKSKPTRCNETGRVRIQAGKPDQSKVKSILNKHEISQTRVERGTVRQKSNCEEMIGRQRPFLSTRMPCQRRFTEACFVE